MEQDRIMEIEEILVNAFPAVEREIYDGWILNFSGGYTYRANGIYPFYGSNYNIEEKIRHCEKQYRNRFLPVVYKMTSAISQNLDSILEMHHYKIVKYVDVLCCSLNNMVIPIEEKIDNDYEYIVMNDMDDEWIEGVIDLIGIPYRSLAEKQRIIFKNIALPVICIKIKHDKKVIGTGLGVIERNYIGLYAIHVDRAYRRQGIAMFICRKIMEKGKMQGAVQAHLQVRRGNDGAFKMYQVLGFKTAYSQWFRMKSWPESKMIFD